MKVTRQQIFAMFDKNYCPQCGKVVAMKVIYTGLPGIQRKQSKQCKGYNTCNFLESEADDIECPDHFILNTQPDKL